MQKFTQEVICMKMNSVQCHTIQYPVHTDMFDMSTEVDINQPVSWNEWTNSAEKRKQKQHNGEMKEFEVKVIKTFHELFDAFENDTHGKGCRHLYTVQHQYSALRIMKHVLNSNEIVLQIDFAENYNCRLSSEVQSYHFGASRNQVTIHNVVAYMRKNFEQN